MCERDHGDVQACLFTSTDEFQNAINDKAPRMGLYTTRR